MKGNKIVEKPNVRPSKLQASRLFTDRKKPRDAFWDNYALVKKDMGEGDPDIRVVVYYGIGGIGKTSLLRQLETEIKGHKDKPKYVIHDMEDCHESYMVLRAIKLRLEDNYNFEFPCFDIGLFVYLKRCGTDIEEPKIKTFIDRSPKLSFLIEALGAIPPVDLAAQVIKAVDIYVKNFRNQINGHEDDLEEIKRIENKTELLEYLTYLFIRDLKDNLKNEKKPFIIMFDTYEKLVDVISGIGNPIDADKWISGEDGLIRNIVPGVLWVIAGREDLQWERKDKDWKDSLDRHILGKLDKNDAISFLEKTKVDDEELREQLYYLTEGVPVYLDLCVKRYYDLKKRGCIPHKDDFGQTSTELITRYKRDMDRPVKRIVYVLSCLGRWTDDMAIHVASKTISNFDEELYDEIKELSIINYLPESNTYNMHEVIRKVFYDDCTNRVKENAEKFAIDFCLDKTKEPNAFSSDYGFYTEQLVYYALHYFKDDEELKKFYLENIDSKLKYLSNYGQKTKVCSAFHNFYKRAASSDNKFLHAEALLSLSCFLDNCGQYSDAIDVLEKAFEFFKKELPATDKKIFNIRLTKTEYLMNGGNYQTAAEEAYDLYNDIMESEEDDVDLLFHCLNIIIVANNYLENFELAESLARNFLEVCNKQFGEDSSQSLVVMGNLAISLQGQKKHKENIDLSERLVDIYSKKYGDDHPETIVAKNNLASAYNVAGKIDESLSLSNEISKKICILGDSHPLAILFKHNLSSDLLRAGKLNEALEKEIEAVTEQERVIGKDHPQTIIFLEQLAEIYGGLGNEEKKLETQKIIIDRKKTRYGETHSKTTSSMNDTAVTLLNMGKNDEAFLLLKEAAELGNKGAQCNLGRMYYEGIGTAVNYDEAFKWLSKAAEGEDAEVQAISFLGSCYGSGIGTEKNEEEAFKYFKIAAEKGESTAQLNLGSMYMQGNTVEQNVEEAFKWFKQAAEQGEPRAQLALGTMYYYGDGVEENDEEAFKWLKEAAEQYESDAHYLLGTMYYSGAGVDQDYEEAFKCFKQAAEQGEPRAQRALGSMYYYGDGVEENNEEALRWLREAAEQGERTAQYLLGTMYYSGYGIDRDYEEALKWFKQAADQDDSKAKFRLGAMFLNGEGTEVNYDEGFRWIKESAELGDSEAQLNLAKWYYKGIIVEEDMDQAFKWFKKSAEQEDVEAQFYLGSMYLEGKGREKNLEEAFKWFKKAAEQGDSDAQYNLCVMYLNGEGTEVNEEEAIRWAKKAAEQGHEAAINVLNSLSN